ncbi:MAG: MBL fold metallo-hydrolase [Candidatus Poseidoniaceae archaeon]
MSEVPEGLEMPSFERKPPRPSATLMITRDGEEGVEVLLGKRSESMPSFPGYWAFPGGGVSRVDKEASQSLGISIQHCAIMREVVEELGLAPSEGRLVEVDSDLREMVAEDKANWFPLALDGDIPSDATGMRVISMRTTPPFGPMRFENSFLHIHSNEHEEFSLIGQTEFVDARWMRPIDMITAWKNNVIKVAPPVVTLLMEVDRCLNLCDQDMTAVAIDLEDRRPGRRSILFANGVEVVPVRTATLPPADHTNCYLVGDPDGDFIVVDPAFRHREGMEKVAEAVERHNGNLVAIFYTHGHSDHMADKGLLKEAFDVPIWSASKSADRILKDGEVLNLGNQEWTVLHTPGHHPEHLCLISSSGLVAGDMVAGIGTILVPPAEGDMIEYIQQLERLLDLDPHLIFPSHGPVIPLPERTLEHYITHRINRHNRVLDAVTSGISALEEIAKFAYADTPDAHPGLAVDQTLSHLLSHEKVGNVRKSGQQWVRA